MNISKYKSIIDKLDIAGALKYYAELTNGDEDYTDLNADFGLILWDFIFAGLLGNSKDELRTSFKEINDSLCTLCDFYNKNKTEECFALIKSIASYFYSFQYLNAEGKIIFDYLSNLGEDEIAKIQDEAVNMIYIVHADDYTSDEAQGELIDLFDNLGIEHLYVIDDRSVSNFTKFKNNLFRVIGSNTSNGVSELYKVTKAIVGPIITDSKDEDFFYKDLKNKKLLTILNNLNLDNRFSSIEIYAPSLEYLATEPEYLRICLRSLPKADFLCQLVTGQSSNLDVCKIVMSSVDMIEKNVAGLSTAADLNEDNTAMQRCANYVMEDLSNDRAIITDVSEIDPSCAWALAYLITKYGLDYDLDANLRNDNTNLGILQKTMKIFTSSYMPYVQHIQRCMELINRDVVIVGADAHYLKLGRVKSTNERKYVKLAIPLQCFLTGQHLDVNLLNVTPKRIEFDLSQVKPWEDVITSDFLKSLEKRVKLTYKFNFDKEHNKFRYLEGFLSQIQKAVILTLAKKPVKISDLCIIDANGENYLTYLSLEECKVTVVLSEDKKRQINVSSRYIAPLNSFSFLTLEGKEIDRSIKLTADTFNILTEISNASVGTYSDKLRRAYIAALNNNDKDVKKYIAEAMIVVNNIVPKGTNDEAFEIIKKYNAKGMLPLLNYDCAGNIVDADISI